MPNLPSDVTFVHAVGGVLQEQIKVNVDPPFTKCTKETSLLAYTNQGKTEIRK